VGQGWDSHFFGRRVHSFLGGFDVLARRNFGPRIPEAKVVRSNCIGGAISRRSALHLRCRLSRRWFAFDDPSAPEYCTPAGEPPAVESIPFD
jgi:hypothetical protein